MKAAMAEPIAAAYHQFDVPTDRLIASPGHPPAKPGSEAAEPA